MLTHSMNHSSACGRSTANPVVTALTIPCRLAAANRSGAARMIAHVLAADTANPTAAQATNAVNDTAAEAVPTIVGPSSRASRSEVSIIAFVAGRSSARATIPGTTVCIAGRYSAMPAIIRKAPTNNVHATGPPFAAQTAAIAASVAQRNRSAMIIIRRCSTRSAQAPDSSATSNMPIACVAAR